MFSGTYNFLGNNKGITISFTFLFDIINNISYV